MLTPCKTVFTLAALAWTSLAGAQITFYEREDFEGRSFTTEQSEPNFQRHGFNDRASSVVVGRDTWLVCENEVYAGQCVSLRAGRYPSLLAMGLNNRISSARYGDDAALQADAPRRHDDEALRGDGRDYSRRRNERTYLAPVLQARAVVGPAEQRCWVAREQVVQQDDHRLGAGLAGAVIGGILGHQLGGGTGRDLATVGGAVAGAAVGANMAGSGGERRLGHREVERCANVQEARPVYWEVTYRFRGQDHQMQTRSQPGDTVRVNRRGEPRG